MADENGLNVFPNGNPETSPSTGNELLYFTAESDILNISNDSVNQCLLKTRNENINCSTISNDSFTIIGKSGDSNSNPVENFDLSLTEAFGNMMLSNNSLNDVTMKTVSTSSEPSDNKSVEVLKDELVEQLTIKPMVEEPLNFIQEEPPNVNLSTLIVKDEDQQTHKNDLLPEIEDNISLSTVNMVNQASEKNNDSKGDISLLDGGICQNIEESPELKTQIQSPHGSSAVLEKSSPNFSGSMLSEQALSFMVGGDSFNELSNSMPEDLKPNDNASNHEISVALKQDVEKHPTPEIGLSLQGTNVISNIVSTNDDNIFKVPAIPVKAVEPKIVSPVNALSNNSEGENFPILNAGKISGFETSVEIPSDNLPVGHSRPNDSLFGTLEPCKLPEVEVASSGLPEPRVFTDFRVERNNIEENLFKVPEPLKEEEDDEFTDAVQFFKDPSSFQYLENIQTSVPTDSVPRSSLYVAFDPLHSKRLSVPQMLNTPLGQLIPESDVANNVSTPVKKHLVDASLRESLGVLISFDSPKPSARVVPEENDPPVPAAVAKQYSEEELQQILKIHELTMQDTYFKKHRELEQEMAKAEEKNRETIEKLSSLVLLFRNSMEEISGVAKTLAIRKEELTSKNDELEKENEKLKDDVKTAGEDLQSVESTFSDFHKRYEQCKSMLKTYKENEEQLKAKLSELEQKLNTLQEQSHEALEKANMEAVVAKKSSEGQVTVLKAQLKKAELKISSLESDLSQVKIENSKLGGICDDLMAKVSEG